jgi:hypothetical protein
MATLDFTGERLTVHAPADSSTDTVLRFGDDADYEAYRVRMGVERASVLAARWNACADALAVLERRPGHITDVAQARAILRRAIYGDER